MNSTCGLVDTLVQDTLKAITLPVSASDSEASSARSFLSLIGVQFPPANREGNVTLFRTLATLVYDSVSSLGIVNGRYMNAIPVNMLNRVKGILTERYRINSGLLPLLTVNWDQNESSLGAIELDAIGTQSVSVFTGVPGVYYCSANNYQIVVGNAQVVLRIPDNVISCQLSFSQLERAIRIDGPAPQNVDVGGEVHVSINGVDRAQGIWMSASRNMEIVFELGGGDQEFRILNLSFRLVYIDATMNANLGDYRSPDEIASFSFINNTCTNANAPDELVVFYQSMLGIAGNSLDARYLRLPRGARKIWLTLMRDIVVLATTLRLD